MDGSVVPIAIVGGRCDKILKFRNAPERWLPALNADDLPSSRWRHCGLSRSRCPWETMVVF